MYFPEWRCILAALGCASNTLSPINCVITEFGVVTTRENDERQKARIADVHETRLPQPTAPQKAFPLKDKNIWQGSFCTLRGSLCWRGSPAQGRSLSVLPAVFFVFVALILCSITWQFTFLGFLCTLWDLGILQDLSVSICWSGFQYICLLLVWLISGQLTKCTFFPNFSIGPDSLAMFLPFFYCRTV